MEGGVGSSCLGGEIGGVGLWEELVDSGLWGEVGSVGFGDEVAVGALGGEVLGSGL